jgi:hypothetical protein
MELSHRRGTGRIMMVLSLWRVLTAEFSIPNPPVEMMIISVSLEFDNLD